MRNVSQSITCCNYPTWKYSHSSLFHYTLLEILQVFSLSVAAELSVAATNRCTAVPPTVNTPAPRQTRPPHLVVWESVVINAKLLIKHSNGEWSMNSTYSEYLHYSGNSGHFILRSVVLEQRNTVPMFGGLGGS